MENLYKPMNSKNKTRRLEVLRLILTSKESATQEAILTELVKAGFNVTQATLSRDLHALKAVKVTCDKGGYSYVLPENPRYRRVIEPAVIPEYLKSLNGSVDLIFSQNIAVVRTRPGYAGVLASNIDMEKMDSVAGTVAGDDTIMVVLKEDASREKFMEEFSKIAPAFNKLFWT